MGIKEKIHWFFTRWYFWLIVFLSMWDSMISRGDDFKTALNNPAGMLGSFIGSVMVAMLLIQTFIWIKNLILFLYKKTLIYFKK